MRETIAELPEFVKVAAEIGVKEVYLQRLVFFDRDEIGLARPDQALYERMSREESAHIEAATALARARGVTFAASGAAAEPALSLKRQARPIAMVAVPAPVERDVFHRQRPGAALLHRAVLAARLRELHAGRCHAAVVARHLERRCLPFVPRGAAFRPAGAGLRQLRPALEPVTGMRIDAGGARPAGDVMPEAQAPAIAVIIPTLDEEDAIGAVVRAIPRSLVGRIIVADGGSRDATAARAAEAGAEVIAAGAGYGRACQAAALAAAGADILVFMDGDGVDDAQAIATLVGPIRNGHYDFVIGSRLRGKREPGSIAWHQLAAGYAAGLAIRLLYGVRYTDMCAFRAIRSDRLRALGMREPTYGWNIEMQMRAAQAGLRILEIPVDYHCRRGGRSKVAGSLRGTLRAGARIIAAFARVALQRPPPLPRR